VSFFKQAIKFYPNWLNYNTSDIDGINYDPENEPTVVGEDYKNSGDSAFGNFAANGPAYDCIDNKIGSVVTIETSGQSSTPEIHFDLTTAIKFDTVILANHNLGTVEVDVEFDDTSGNVGFDTCNCTTLNIRYPKGYYVLDNAVTVSSNTATFVSGEIGIALFETDSEPAETVFEVDLDPTGAAFTANNLTMGEVIASQKWTAPHAPETQGWRNVDRYGHVINRTQGGQNYGTFNHGIKKRITLSWKNLSSSQLDDLEEVFQVTKGSTYPMFVDLGEHATQHYLRYMRLVGDFSSVPIAGGTYHNVQLTLEEE